MLVPSHVLLPGDECFRHLDPEARSKRMQIRNQIKMVSLSAIADDFGNRVIVCKEINDAELAFWATRVPITTESFQKIASNRELRKEVARLTLEKQARRRLAEALSTVTV